MLLSSVSVNKPPGDSRLTDTGLWTKIVLESEAKLWSLFDKISTSKVYSPSASCPVARMLCKIASAWVGSIDSITWPVNYTEFGGESIS